MTTTPLRHAATHFNTPQHTATVEETQCQNDHYTARHCIMLQHTATGQMTQLKSHGDDHNATHCNTLQNTATHCNTLQHTATHCNRQRDAAQMPRRRSHYNTFATHCNTLQQAKRHCSRTTMTINGGYNFLC